MREKFHMHTLRILYVDFIIDINIQIMCVHVTCMFTISDIFAFDNYCIEYLMPYEVSKRKDKKVCS